jgi:hypothetical protein
MSDQTSNTEASPVEEDPIFAAIERHKSALSAQEALTEEDPAYEAAADLQGSLTGALMRTKPTTKAGAYAAMEHFISLDWDECLSPFADSIRESEISPVPKRGASEPEGTVLNNQPENTDPFSAIDALEGEIEDIVSMSAVLQTVMKDMWRQEVPEIGAERWTKLMLTKDQVSSIDFVVVKLGLMVRDLSTKYFEALKDERIST